MKSIAKYILGAAACCLTTSGCNDFLDLSPISAYAESNMYKTQSDFEGHIAAVYSAQQGLYDADKGFYRTCILRSDDIRSGASYDGDINVCLQDATKKEINDYWVIYWKIISRTNKILDKIDAGQFASEQMRSWIKGEALMLRAFCYHELGVYFGGVPLITKTATFEQVKSVARSTQEETFAQALADYEAAWGLLPDKWESKYAGRATKAAAAAMAGRLYMFMNRPAEALPWLKLVYEDPNYGFAEKFIDCFTDDFDNTAERVWEAQFTGGNLGEGQQAASSFFPEGCHGLNDELSFQGTSAAVTVSDDLRDDFEEGDLRKDVSMRSNLLVNGTPDVTWRVTKYLHYVKYMPTAIKDWANNIPIIRFTDAAMLYAEALNATEFSNTGVAIDILNKVRARAGLKVYKAGDAEVADQAAFLKTIQEERRHEFAFEGQRWADLVRWNIVEEVMNKFFAQASEGGARYKMEKTHRLLPIPKTELDRYNNKAVMWQNEGYN